MSKTWETKDRILKSMRSGKKMPSEICTELGLSPSTVTQHLQELEAMGAIRKVENPFVKKWKYFELNPEFNAKIMENRGSMAKPKISYIAALIVAFVVAGAIVFIAAQQTHSASTAQVTVPVRLTDPPTVPNGTQALLIDYSSVEVHVNKGGGNATGWTSVAGRGSVNLLSLINESEVIGSATLPKNSIVDMIRFNVTSARIEINGTYYNVTVPSGSVLTHVSGRGNINSSSGLLLDLSPTVATIYTNTSTIFVLVPSVRAVVVPNGNTSTSIGSRARLSADEKYHLDTAAANITIASATLSQNGNITTFSVTVRNNGNQSVQLNHVLIYGNDTVTINPPIVLPASVSSNGSIEGGVGVGSVESGGIASNASESHSAASSNAATSTIPYSGNGSAGAKISIKTNLTVQDRPDVVGAFGGGLGIATNSTPNLTDLNVRAGENEHEAIGILVNGSRVGINGSLGASLSDREDIGSLFKVSKAIVSLRVLNFQITQSGQLLLPFSSTCAKYDDTADANSSATGVAAASNLTASACTYSDLPSLIYEGYTLAPGQSATFTFSGRIGLAFGHIIISPIPGENYSVVVRGEEGASASVNITAT